MDRRGFTLIEVLTVVLIVGVLISITSYVFNTSLVRSRDSQRKTDLDTVKNALEQYYLDTRTYPPAITKPESVLVAKLQLENAIEGCGEGNRKYLAPFYLTTIPEDPKAKINREVGCNQAVKGQYLYLPKLKASDGTLDPKPSYYYLAAFVERNVNYAGYNFVSTYVSDFSLDDSRYRFCDTDTTNCSHNYFIKNSNNN